MAHGTHAHDGPRRERNLRPHRAVTRFIIRDGLLAAAVICYITSSILAAIGIAHFRPGHFVAVLLAADVFRTTAFLLLIAWGFMRAHVERAWGRAIRALHDVTEPSPPPHEPAIHHGEPQWPPHRRRAG